MLRIGKNPKDSDKTQVAAERQEEARTETDKTSTAANSEAKGLVDSTGNPIPRYQGVEIDVAREYVDVARARAGDLYAQSLQISEEDVVLSIPRKEFERLSAKTNEVLTEAALAQERIGKDQQEIEQLKMETRAMLGKLRAA
jgi:hypothetical protein